MRTFLLDLLIAALLGLATGIFLQEKEIRKENQKHKEDIELIEWINAANPQNNILNWGDGDGKR